MRVSVSAAARKFVSARGGRLWVWAARPRLCCSGTPAYMHADIQPPTGLLGFCRVASADVESADLEIWFRAPGGRFPDVLEIGLHGRRRPSVEAYWDGCLMAL